MSSDNYFNDSEQLDSAFLAELDAIEVAHSHATQPPSQTNRAQTSRASPISTTPCTRLLSTTLNPPGEFTQDVVSPKPEVVPIDVDAEESYDQFFDEIDPLELEILDKDIEQAYMRGSSIPSATLGSGSSMTMARQLTLFGDTLPLVPSRPRRQIQSRPPHSPRKPFGKKARKVKKWDHTAFAKSGWKSSKGKEKAKSTALNCDEGDDAFHSTEEFEQFPAPISDSMLFIIRLSYHKVLIIFAL